MPSILCRSVLFLSGYSPLFIIFTIQYYAKYKLWALLPLMVGAIGVIGLIVFLRWVRSGAPRPLHVESVQRKDAEVIAYIFAYVFPFLNLNVEDTANAVSLVIFFLVLMILNVSSNMIHINPEDILNLVEIGE